MVLTSHGMLVFTKRTHHLPGSPVLLGLDYWFCIANFDKDGRNYTGTQFTPAEHTLAMCSYKVASIDGIPSIDTNPLQQEVLTRLFSKTTLIHIPLYWLWALLLAIISLQSRTMLEENRRQFIECIPPTVSLATATLFLVNLLMKKWSLVRWRLRS